MRVLMVASECFPLVKTGGLADVVGALPAALEAGGCETRVLLPAYPGVVAGLSGARIVGTLNELFGGSARLVLGRAQGGLQVVALDAPHLFDRPGNPYVGPDGRDWWDNHRRFAALAAAATHYTAEPDDSWTADLVHCHDWQAGLTPVYMRRYMRIPTPIVFTIHNIAFQGCFPAATVDELGLPRELYTSAGFEYWGQLSFLKAGLVFSDRLTTVSPTYAIELRTSRFGMGMEGVLASRAADFVGILNGIDDATWNPATDRLIRAHYSAAEPEEKEKDRSELQAAMGLRPGPASLLVCVISRLTYQKGVDLLASALPALLEAGGQLALLGTGTPEFESLFVAASHTYPGRVATRIAYDENLSHRMMAGADAIVVPSRFEPCGLTQLYGLRYGTIPIVSRTGGLADSVIDANEAAVQAGVATGVVFDLNDSEGLPNALRRATALHAGSTVWRRMMAAAMRQDVSWARSAAKYRAVYDELVAARRGGRLTYPGPGG